jgi:hypothetical protein
MSQFQAWDQNEPWWNLGWTMMDHVMVNPLAGNWGPRAGQQAAAVGNSANPPQAYSDHVPSESTVTNASILAVPGGYAAAVRRQKQ